MQVLPLSSQRFCLVDDEDFEWLSQIAWSYIGVAGPTERTGYASSRGRGRHESIHRCIMACHGLLIEHLIVDHKNGWGLDNRKQNLRMVTFSENNANRYTGSGRACSLRSGKSRWEARLGHRHLGYFDTREEALQRRIEEEMKLGWLTAVERAMLEDALRCDLEQLTVEGVIDRRESGSVLLEDQYSTELLPRHREIVIRNRQQREAASAAYWQQKADGKQRRLEEQEVYRDGFASRWEQAMRNLSETNRAVYFHKSLGWRVRTAVGEIAVGSRQEGLELFAQLSYTEPRAA